MTIDRLTDLCAHPTDASLRRRATRIAWVCALLLAAGRAPAGGLEWSMQARGLGAGDLRIERLEAQAAGDGSVAVRASGIELPGLGEWGELRIDCPPAARRCESGRLQRIGASEQGVGAEAIFERSLQDLRLAVDDASAVLQWGGVPRLAVTGWPLAGWLNGPGLPVELFGGQVDAQALVEDDGFSFQSRVGGLAFDTADGRYAGDGLVVLASLHRVEEGLEGRFEWQAGEVLLDAVYLPPPVSPVAIDVRVPGGDTEVLRLHARVRADAWLDATAEARLDRTALRAAAPADGVERIELGIERLDLQSAWPLGPESLVARAGWPDLEVAGSVTGTAAWSPGEPPVIDLDWRAVAVEDPAGRIGVRGLEGRLELGGGRERIDAGFDAATLYRLPIAATRWTLEGRDGTLALVEPVRVPLLDGALRIDRLAIERDAEGPPAIDLDAAIEPLDLERLTGALGLPRFGGTLSGRIPGVRLDGETLRVNGGLDLDLFSGQARISGLSVERPFGTLPALSASLEFERLDLAPLTTAFEFGAIEGELSGHLLGLRLLDWQPVAFDAWLYTLTETAKRRRISQRAVDQIARLGGGGAAALSAPILRLFDDFAYEQIGLGCRLAANVCTMRGLSDVEGGGYRIVAGRGVPRLDVVGFRRRVDWPVLLAQLRAATQGEGVRVGN